MCVKPESSRAMRERLEGFEGRQECVKVGKLSLRTIKLANPRVRPLFALYVFETRMAGDLASL